MESEIKNVFILSVVICVVVGLILDCNTISQWGICFGLIVLGVVFLRIMMYVIILLVAWLWWRKHGADVKQKIMYYYHRILHPFMDKDKYEKYFNEKIRT